jgi:hypothetical protein
MWADKLVSIGSGFGERKVQITFALTIHAAVGIDKLNDATIEIQAKLDQVLKYVVEYKTPPEIEWEKEMDKLGGRKSCLDDPIKMSKLARIFARQTYGVNEVGLDMGIGNSASMAARASEVLAPSAPLNDNSYAGTLSATQRHAIYSPVDTLIEENTALYERKLNQQTKQIKDAIKESTAIILNK